MSLRYACAVCRKIITDWRITQRPDGKIEFQAHCHGDVHSIVISLDLQGVLFSGTSVLELPTRDPDEYIRRAAEEEGKGTTGRVGRRTPKSRGPRYSEAEAGDG